MDLTFLPWIDTNLLPTPQSISLLPLDFDSIQDSLPLLTRVKNFGFRLQYAHRLIMNPSKSLKIIGLGRFYALLNLSLTTHFPIFIGWKNAPDFYAKAFSSLSKFEKRKFTLIFPILDQFAHLWNQMNRSTSQIQRWYRFRIRRRKILKNLKVIFFLNKRLNPDLTLVILTL